MDDRERYAAGMTVRRAVLGDAHVDRSLTRRTEFTEEFQDLITRYAWGEIWTRPGLERKTRSCMTLSMMVALGHWEELRAARAGSLQQRPDARGDQGGAAAGRDLLRGARRQPRLRRGRGSVRGDGQGLSWARRHVGD